MKKCEVCGNKFHSYNKAVNLNLCMKHYTQAYTYGKIFERTCFDPNEIIKHDDYAEIILYNIHNKEKARAKIDLDDVDRCSEYKWNYGRRYVQTRDKDTGKCIRLHRFIMDFPDNKLVDHKDHDTLDNRKSKLRICTQSQNLQNQRIQSNNTSGTTGVCWASARNKWIAHIYTNHKQTMLGAFDKKEDAIKARKDAEIKYFGEFAFKK